MRWIAIVIAVLFLLSCNDTLERSPRPHQYPQLNLPNDAKKIFSNTDCPFEMNIPEYATVEKKDFLFDDVPAGECWFDLTLQPLGATIHCSYYRLGREFTFDNLVNDAFTMVSKHNKKANYREEFAVKNDDDVSGIIFKINGPVATPYQFFVTDSTSHFLRGALYFDQKIDFDSVAPIVDHLEMEIDKMLLSMRWN